MEQQITLKEMTVEQFKGEQYEIVAKNLAIVLDFVERWNKQDAEKEVANAAHFLEGLI